MLTRVLGLSDGFMSTHEAKKSIKFGGSHPCRRVEAYVYVCNDSEIVCALPVSLIIVASSFRYARIWTLIHTSIRWRISRPADY